MVGPKIAAAAAQRALEVLAEEDAAAAAEVAQELAAAQAGGGDAAMLDAAKNGQQPDGVSRARWLGLGTGQFEDLSRKFGKEGICLVPPNSRHSSARVFIHYCAPHSAPVA